MAISDKGRVGEAKGAPIVLLSYTVKTRSIMNKLLAAFVLIFFLYDSIDAQYLSGHYVTKDGQKADFQIKDFTKEKPKIKWTCKQQYKVIEGGKEKKIKAEDVEYISFDLQNVFVPLVGYSIKVKKQYFYAYPLEIGNVDLYEVLGADCRVYFVIKIPNKEYLLPNKLNWRMAISTYLDLDNKWHQKLMDTKYKNLQQFIREYNPDLPRLSLH